MKYIEDSITALAVIAGMFVPIKAGSVPVEINNYSNQLKCSLTSQKLVEKSNYKISNYTNFDFNKNLTFNLKQSGIIATFAPQDHTGKKIELQQLASALGYERFAWVNYVEQDPYGIRDRNGNIVQTPYNDPPPGGYQYDAADHYPFYWDIEKCPDCYSRHHYQHPKISNKFQLVFEDHPYDPRLQSGESVNFVTHLVGIKKTVKPQNFASVSNKKNFLETNSENWDILTTFSWKLTNTTRKRSRVFLVEKNINSSQLSPSLLALIKTDGGNVNNSLIAHKYISRNHQHPQQSHQNPHLPGCL